MVSICPKLTPERRQELKDKLGLRNDSLWWASPGNRQKAKDYAASHQWANRAGTAAPVNTSMSTVAATPYHGVAEFVGITRPVYFDLGGVYNLADAEAYTHVCAAAAVNTNAATLVSPTDLGFSERGVPIDMAGASGTGSSLVWVQKWGRLTIHVCTRNGRRITLSQQVVGFIRRSTPLLLLGQHTCTICGYRTIEQQDHDRSNDGGDHSRSAEASGLGGGMPRGTGGHSRNTGHGGGSNHRRDNGQHEDDNNVLDGHGGGTDDTGVSDNHVRNGHADNNIVRDDDSGHGGGSTHRNNSKPRVHDNTVLGSHLGGNHENVTNPSSSRSGHTENDSPHDDDSSHGGGRDRIDHELREGDSGCLGHGGGRDRIDHELREGDNGRKGHEGGGGAPHEGSGHRGGAPKSEESYINSATNGDQHSVDYSSNPAAPALPDCGICTLGPRSVMQTPAEHRNSAFFREVLGARALRGVFNMTRGENNIAHIALYMDLYMPPSTSLPDNVQMLETPNLHELPRATSPDGVEEVKEMEIPPLVPDTDSSTESDASEEELLPLEALPHLITARAQDVMAVAPQTRAYMQRSMSLMIPEIEHYTGWRHPRLKTYHAGTPNQLCISWTGGRPGTGSI